MPVLVLLGMLPTVAPSAQSQTPGPLNFGNNFFVTGDYIVAGAYNINQKFTTVNGISYTVGTINVPDVNPKGVRNPGITGATSVPNGAQIVAALLYWQTVEKVGATGSGQNGYFLPVANAANLPNGFPGYAISGTNVSGSNTVSWSSGGCGGTSTGKVVRTYRADVAGGLPVDSNGNSLANSSFQVLLPSVGNPSTPLTLGATLVVIYRIPSGSGGSNIPLNAIVIYDGDYAQTSAQLKMTQQMQGFYDAAANPVSRLTHIVGSGQSNKFQTVYLGSGSNSLLPLPSLYGNKLPPFPGWYGTWDNPTWTFTNASGTNPGVLPGAPSATTQVVPTTSNQGCVSWGAVIVSTTVKNSDGDGILDSWKTDPRGPGYCDASINNGICNGPGDSAWVDLTGAAKGQKDIFLQYDYMCSTVLGPPSLGPANSCKLPTLQPNGTYTSDYSFDPRLAVDPANGETAIDKVVEAFDNHTGSSEPFVLHAIPGNAILESDPNVTCTDSAQTGPLCPFPNEPGTIGFREGVSYIKNLSINPSAGTLCSPGTGGCVPVFQHGKKDSYHYALFSHGVGLPSWFLSDGSLQMSQTGTMVTFTTSFPHGLAPIPGDTACPSSPRVSVIFSISNPNLDGSYCANVTGPNTFTITVGANASATRKYFATTDPNLAVANGQVTSMSGFSDVGGQNSVVSLGYGDWGPPNNPTSDGNTWQVKAGTFMHELGHTLGLTHGGTFYQSSGFTGNPPNYTPTFEPNCKPNSQSIMNYQFQVDLLLDSAGNQFLDYSKQDLADLVKSSSLGPIGGTDYANTAWFQLTSYVQALLLAQGSSVVPQVMSAHCDGSPRPLNQGVPSDSDMTYVSGDTSSFFSSPASGLDVNYDGNPGETLHGHDEWDGSAAGSEVSPGLDLQQVSALGTVSTIGPGGESGALKPAGGGGALKPAGGGGIKSDINHETANAYTRPPRSLTASEAVSARTITLNWTQPTFGQIVQYNVYRAAGTGPFTLVKSVFPIPPATTFPATTTTDNPQCNPAGYSYEVSAVVNSDAQPPQPQESLPSNVASGPGQGPLTGCYTGASANVPPPVSAALAFSPSTASVGATIPITWSLTDDFYPPSGTVMNQSAATLIAIGPIPSDPQCTTATQPPVFLNYQQIHKSSYPQPATILSAAGAGVVGANPFTFNWNTTGLLAGCYFFELDTDSTQYQQTSVFTLLILESGPTITTTTLPNGVVGGSYSSTLTQSGGIGTVQWTVKTGSLPSGITLTNTGALVGTPTAPGTYNFTVQVTDSQGNFSILGSPQLSITVAGPAQTASTLSVLVNGVASPPTVVAYVAKGSWNAGVSGSPGGGTGVSLVNIEGTSVTNAAIGTPGVVNSCASNSLTGTTVCTADNNDVYVLSGTTVSNTIPSGATGSGIAFQGGVCTTCGVVMDSVHNQALIAVGTSSAATGGFQILNLAGASPSLGNVFASPAVTVTPANISPSIMLDPTRNTTTPIGNTSYGSGAIVLSAGASGDFEIADVTTPANPQFFENLIPGLGLNLPDGPALMPGSSGEDTSTGIALAPVESANPSQVFIVDLTQATFSSSGSPGTWASVGSNIQSLSESSNLSAVGAAGVAVAQGNTHTAVITGEVGGSTITAVLLPKNSGTGTPAATDWVTCTIPAAAAGAPAFQMGYDPHTVTAYQSPTNGHAIALIADQSGPNNGPGYLAVVDLTQMLNPSLVQRTAAGHGCQSGTLPTTTVVNFVPVP